MSDQKNINFEQSLQSLEQLVQKMESGDLPLEDSLEAFEQGVKLVRECQSALASAEQRVKILMEKEGDAQLKEFKEDE